MKELEVNLKLYEIYLNDLQKYSTIIWQFPTALVTVNVLAINFLIDKPHVLIFIPIVNSVLIHAVFKHVHHQKAIIEAIKRIERKLKDHDEIDEKVIPDFEVKDKVIKVNSSCPFSKRLNKILNSKCKHYFFKPYKCYLKLSSANLLKWGLCILNTAFFVITIITIILKFLDC